MHLAKVGMNLVHSGSAKYYSSLQQGFHLEGLVELKKKTVESLL